MNESTQSVSICLIGDHLCVASNRLLRLVPSSMYSKLTGNRKGQNYNAK